jgi:hypothetical protein
MLKSSFYLNLKEMVGLNTQIMVFCVEGGGAMDVRKRQNYPTNPTNFKHFLLALFK